MRLKLYDQYKESGEESVGEIPRSWEVKKLKYLLDDIKIGPFGSSLKLDEMHESFPYKVYGQENLISRDFSLGRRFISDNKFNNLLQYEVKPKDILISMMGTIGKCQVVPETIQQGIMDSHLMRIRVDTNKAFPEFISLVIDESNYVKEQFKVNSNGSIMSGLNSKIIKSANIVLPSKIEQKIIVSYLRKKSKQIDEVISKKKQQIEILKQYRQSLITETVTRGLNSDVKLKESGVRWLGNIPVHWEIKSLKYTSEVHLSNVDKKSVKGQKEIFLCNYVDVYYNDEISDAIDFMKATAKPEQIKRFKLKKNDVLITKDSESPSDIAVPAWVSKDFDDVVCGYHLALIRPNKQMDGKFLFYALKSITINEQYQTKANGVTRFGLGKEAIKNGLILVPPLNEQIAIANRLDSINKNIKEIIIGIECQIEKLQKYRQSLIYEAVTGKIDVREYVTYEQEVTS